MVEVVAAALGDMEVIFVGGSTLGLYMPDDDLGVRATDDVDCVVEIAGYAEHLRVEAALRDRGFSQPITMEKTPICRWWIDDIAVDVIATIASPMGPSNPWYLPGSARAIRRKLPNGREVRVLPPAFFFASKVEAYYSRGAQDPLSSRDLEDLIVLLARCSGLEADVLGAPADLQERVAAWASAFLGDGHAAELVEGHLGGRLAARLPAVLALISRLRAR